MLMWQEMKRRGVVERMTRKGPSERGAEQGSGVVEWLGISALSIGVLVALFSALESVGLDLIEAIRSQLGV